jgi:hypothetical protein
MTCSIDQQTTARPLPLLVFVGPDIAISFQGMDGLTVRTKDDCLTSARHLEKPSAGL